MKYISESDIDKITSETGKALAAQEKVSIMIAKDIGPYWEGGINGHMFRIKTGMVVKVPRDLAVLISQNADVLEQSEKAAKEYTRPGGKNATK